MYAPGILYLRCIYIHVCLLVTIERSLSLGLRIGTDTDWVYWTINSACLMSMGGENTGTCSFTSVEHVSEETAKSRLLLVTSVTTDIDTKNGIVWTAARHRAECQPFTWKKY